MDGSLDAWLLATLPELPPEPAVLPEMPAGLREAPLCFEPPRCGCGAVCFPGPDDQEPGVCTLTRSPGLLADRFAAEWLLVQQHTARMWRAAAAMHAATGAPMAEFVGDDLALLTNTHPRSGAALLVTAVSACEVPELVALLEAGQLGERHVSALLDEAGRWTDTAEQRRAVLALTLARCQQGVDAGQGWPTPAQLRARLRTAAILLDLTAADKGNKTVAERRGVSVYPSGPGGAGLSIEGPQVQISQMMDAIRARAQALGALPGDSRTLDQRLFDAAHDLLTVDGDGGESPIPAVGLDGERVTISVRGVQVALVMPYSVAAGGELELASIAGLGPVLPSTARELLAHADTIERVAVHASTGQVLAVDPPIPGPGRRRRRLKSAPTTQPPTPEAVTSDPQPAPIETTDAVPAEPVPEQLQQLLDQLTSTPVVLRDLSSDAYRVGRRLRRHIERRDRTCTFPGCTVPGRRCDIDHRDPWPYGPTSENNCHCLCRHHHRAKQRYFTVELDQHGNTIWTTPDGRQYRRPPPEY